MVLKHEYKNIFINYEFFEGGKTLLVFLHGWGSNLNLMKPLAKNIVGDYSYLLIDFPPFGDSQEPKTPWNLNDYVVLTKEIIKNTENAYNFCSIILFGHSFGGRVAIKLASLKPKKLEKLVLFASAGLKPKFSLKTKFKIALYKHYKKTGNPKMKNFGSPDYKVLSPIMKQTFNNVISEDLASNCKQISCNTLIVFGNKDTETPLYMGKRMKRLIKNSFLYVVNEGDHFAYIKNIQTILPVVLQFL